ncbi:MAG: RNA methyltransferase, partial [Chloroflexi bacterium]
MNRIHSLKNARVKLVHQLQTRPRARREERKLVLEGVRLINDALDAKQRPHFVFYLPERTPKNLIERLDAQGVDVLAVTDEVMRHMSDTQQPQGVLGVFDIPLPRIPKNASQILILDAIRDPGNMGTMLRTAAAANVDVVVLAPACVDPYNPKVLRSGMGAHFRLPILEASWEEIANYCQDVHIYLADGVGDVDYWAVDWRDAWALIIGSEAHGAGDEAR